MPLAQPRKKPRLMMAETPRRGHAQHVIHAQRQNRDIGWQGVKLQHRMRRPRGRAGTRDKSPRHGTLRGKGGCDLPCQRLILMANPNPGGRRIAQDQQPQRRTCARIATARPLRFGQALDAHGKSQHLRGAKRQVADRRDEGLFGHGRTLPQIARHVTHPAQQLVVQWPRAGPRPTGEGDEVSLRSRRIAAKRSRQMSHSIAEIAAALGLQAAGETGLHITHAAEPAQAGPDALAMAMNPKFAAGLAEGKARAAILWPGADWQAMGLQAAIFAPRPRWAMAGVTELLDPGYDFGAAIHPLACIDPSAHIGPEAQIGPFTHIGPRAWIGARARIAAHVTVAEDARLGDDVILHAGARIGARVRIGDRYIGQPNSVVGGCGFSFVTPEPSGAEDVRATLSGERQIRSQKWHRIQSLGAVVIGDDVELGANSSIDRGTIRDTVIGSGTKIDSVCQIGHNVQMGEDCMMCGMAGVAGSARIGNRVLLAGKVAVNDNIFIGDDVIVGGASRVYTNVPAGRTVLGDPATKLEIQLEIRKTLRRLPRLAATVAKLQTAVFGTGTPPEDQTEQG